MLRSQPHSHRPWDARAPAHPRPPHHWDRVTLFLPRVRQTVEEMRIRRVFEAEGQVRRILFLERNAGVLVVYARDGDASRALDALRGAVLPDLSDGPLAVKQGFIPPRLQERVHVRSASFSRPLPVGHPDTGACTSSGSPHSWPHPRAANYSHAASRWHPPRRSQSRSRSRSQSRSPSRPQSYSQSPARPRSPLGSCASRRSRSTSSPLRRRRSRSRRHTLSSSHSHSGPHDGILSDHRSEAGGSLSAAPLAARDSTSDSSPGTVARTSSSAGMAELAPSASMQCLNSPLHAAPSRAASTEARAQSPAQPLFAQETTVDLAAPECNAAAPAVLRSPSIASMPAADAASCLHDAGLPSDAAPAVTVPGDIVSTAAFPAAAAALRASLPSLCEAISRLDAAVAASLHSLDALSSRLDVRPATAALLRLSSEGKKAAQEVRNVSRQYQAAVLREKARLAEELALEAERSATVACEAQQRASADAAAAREAALAAEACQQPDEWDGEDFVMRSSNDAETSALTTVRISDPPSDPNNPAMLADSSRLRSRPPDESLPKSPLPAYVASQPPPQPFAQTASAAISLSSQPEVHSRSAVASAATCAAPTSETPRAPSASAVCGPCAGAAISIHHPGNLVTGTSKADASVTPVEFAFASPRVKPTTPPIASVRTASVAMVDSTAVSAAATNSCSALALATNGLETAVRAVSSPIPSVPSTTPVPTHDLTSVTGHAIPTPAFAASTPTAPVSDVHSGLRPNDWLLELDGPADAFPCADAEVCQQRAGPQATFFEPCSFVALRAKGVGHQVRVHWRGWPAQYNEWQPAASLRRWDAARVDAFLLAHKDRLWTAKGLTPGAEPKQVNDMDSGRVGRGQKRSSQQLHAASGTATGSVSEASTPRKCSRYQAAGASGDALSPASAPGMLPLDSSSVSSQDRSLMAPNNNMPLE